MLQSDDQGEPPVACTPPAQLRPGAETILGRQPWICCAVTGMCTGNTDPAQNVVCPSPARAKSSAMMIAGQDIATCCVTTGMCTGNTDKDLEPDFVCPGVSQLAPNAAQRLGRSERQCCHVTGMCSENTDTATEPDVQCARPSVLVELPFQVKGRGDECCRCLKPSSTVTHGFCVATADGSLTAENTCTSVMKYAACGDQSSILRCAQDPSYPGCDECEQAYPFRSFQHDAQSYGCTAQQLCMGADPFGCTYEYRESEETCEARAGVENHHSISDEKISISSLPAVSVPVNSRSAGPTCACGSGDDVKYSGTMGSMNDVAISDVVLMCVGLLILTLLRVWGLFGLASLDDYYHPCSAKKGNESEFEQLEREEPRPARSDV